MKDSWSNNNNQFNSEILTASKSYSSPQRHSDNQLHWYSVKQTTKLTIIKNAQT